MLVGALAVPSFAQATYANSSVGVSLGAATIRAETPVDAAAILSFDGSRYLDGRWEGYAHALVGLGTAAKLATFVTGVQLGAHYLLSEDVVRPWLGVHLVGSYATTLTGVNLVAGGGLGGEVGLHWLVAESVAVGGRVFGDWVLNFARVGTVSHAGIFGGSLHVAAFF